MIKVLMVLDSLGRGGSQAYVMNILRNIDRNQFQVDFVESHLLNGGYDEEVKELGSKVWTLPRFKVYNILSYYKSWRNFLSTGEYDIVHGHTSNSAGVYLRIAKKNGSKTIVHSHSAGYRGNFIEKIVKRVFAKSAKSAADLWFSCSDLASKRLYGPDYKDSPKHYTLPNAICVSDYYFDKGIRDKIRKCYNINSDVKLYGHIGSFTSPKNHKFLLLVFEKISQLDSNAKLMLCGDGPLRQEIKEQISSLGLEDKIIMTGVVSMIHRYFMAMDVMLFPSLFEGLPISVVEAQATGLPVLHSDVITKDVDITNLVTTLNLDAGFEIWAQKAITLNNANRMCSFDTIKNSVFNMETSIKQLEALYINLVNN